MQSVQHVRLGQRDQHGQYYDQLQVPVGLVEQRGIGSREERSVILALLQEIRLAAFCLDVYSVGSVSRIRDTTLGVNEQTCGAVIASKFLLM